MAPAGFKNVDQCNTFNTLKKIAPCDLKQELTVERIENSTIPAGGGLIFNYAAKAIHDEVIDCFEELAEEQKPVEQYRELVNGAVMNTGEKRKVLHHLVRGQLDGPVIHEGRNLRDFYAQQLQKIEQFGEKVHTGEIRGSTGKRFTSVVQIGIGGSDLGPRALYLALEQYVKQQQKTHTLDARFISNVDPDDAAAVLSGLDLESTLFIVVSKSGTTQETLANRALVLELMEQADIPGLQPEKHMLAVTSETSPMASSNEYVESFFIDDFIGGRYSATSAVGAVVLVLAFGKEVFRLLLEGAHEADRKALDPNVRNNAPLMDAMIGMWERNILGLPATAVLPYCQALNRFPAHLQQLDMESNGKRVNRQGEPISYSSGPVVFGEPGTNGQHSFYQLLHQGTDTVPLQFIGFSHPQTGFDPQFEGSSSQTKLKANLAAQIVAFAMGKEDKNPNKQVPGGVPSSLLYGERLTPRALGALLAHYENKIMFQGFIWNINSFDQEGVQLGKILTKQILSDADVDPLLAAYMGLLDGGNDTK
jgi:glucose-6-phosphate isomerase